MTRRNIFVELGLASLGTLTTSPDVIAQPRYGPISNGLSLRLKVIEDSLIPNKGFSFEIEVRNRSKRSLTVYELRSGALRNNCCIQFCFSGGAVADFSLRCTDDKTGPGWATCTVAPGKTQAWLYEVTSYDWTGPNLIGNGEAKVVVAQVNVYPSKRAEMGKVWTGHLLSQRVDLPWPLVDIFPLLVDSGPQ